MVVRALFLLLLLFLPWRDVSADRKVNITTFRCPKKYCSNMTYTIVHVTADSLEKRNNSIHYLYSTIYSPTIIVAYFEDVPGPIHLTIDWTKLTSSPPKKNALKFNQDYDHFMALVVPRIIAFEDPKDKLFYTETDILKSVSSYSLEKVNWNVPKVEGQFVEFTGEFLGGTISVQCNVSESGGREEQLPSLLYTDNSTRFSFTLKELTGLVKPSNNTRLGLELFSVSPRSNRGATNLIGHKSIDDEYTPAVFKTVVVNTTGAHGNSYIAWKPVAYTDATRNLGNQIPSYEYLVIGGNDQRITSQEEDRGESIGIYPPDFKSIAFAFQPADMNAYGINISFGQEKDGWYGNKYKQLSWDGLVGYGEPQFDTFSTTVLITIIAGLGAPLIVLVCGGLFVGVRKYKENKMASTYGRIN